VPPVGYAAMIVLVRNSRLVVTDSGGLQEEAAWLRVPTLVLRRSTPRWEGIAEGFAVLVGLDVGRALSAAEAALSAAALGRIAGLACPYGDGHTAARVVALLRDDDIRATWKLREPDYVGRAIPQ
jgi:UDP-N-acetylglucosamine 2-epimerase (non-hydrolysing)